MSRAKQLADAIDAFVKGTKADGTWDSIKACCILAGWDSLDGCLVPLKGPAPTNNNFTDSDLDRATGLVGDGSTTYLDSNRASSDDPQDDHHLAVYVSAAATGPTMMYIASDAAVANDNSEIYRSTADLVFRSRNAAASTASGLGASTGLLGISRDNSANYEYRVASATSTDAIASVASSTLNFFVFGRNNGSINLPSDGRLAFYSIGESLDLEALDTRVSALITAIGNAI